MTPSTPKKSRGFQLSLQYFLSLQFMFAALLPIAIIGMLSFSLVHPKIKENTVENQKALTLSISGHINLMLDNASKSLGLLATLLSAKHFNPENTETLLRDFSTSNTFFDAIYLSNSDGIVEVAALPPEQEYLKSNFTGLDMSRIPFYQASTTQLKSLWSNVFLSVVSGRLTIAYTVPMANGALIGEVSIDSLPALVSKISRQQSLVIMVLDQRGHLIAHPESRYSGQQINLSNVPLFAAAHSNIVSGQFNFQNQTLFGTAIKMKNPEWVIIGARYQDIINQQNNATMAILIISGIIALFAAIIFGNLIAKVFSKKFKQYTNNAKCLAEGNFALTFHRSRISEFMELAEHQRDTAVAIKHREDTITTREQRYKQLLEQSPIGVIEWSLDHSVLQWNSTAAVMFGYTQEEIQTTKNKPEIDKLLKLLRTDLVEGNRQQVFENPITTRFGDNIQCLIIHSAISIEGNQPQAYLTMVQNITENRKNEQKLKEINEELETRVTGRTHELEKSNDGLKSALKTLRVAQSELVKSEKLAGLGSLVAGIAHELNTPIGNSLMTSTTLSQHTHHVNSSLVKETLSQDQLEDYLRESKVGYEILTRNLGRASDLISSFKQMAVDQTSSKRRTFNLDTLVKEVITTLNPSIKKYAVDIKIQIPESIELNSYPGALGQIITNLVNNAMIHGLEGKVGGLINIRGEVVDNSKVRITFTDNGKGIPPEYIDSIFNPFFTTKLGQGGSGLGLNIVYNTSENILKGHITVSSALNHHTTFALTIPLNPPKPIDIVADD